MSEAVTAEDPRYHEVFDLTRETGKGIAGDLAPLWNALRDKSPVHKGLGGELLGEIGRDAFRPVREAYTFFSFETCDRAFRDGETFANRIYHDLPMAHAYGETILWSDGAWHRALRAVAQPMFLQPKAATWWRQNWIDPIVATLCDNIARKEKSDLNQDLCVRLPMQVITQAFGMDGDKALDFRNHMNRATGVAPATPEEKAASAEIADEMLKELIAARRTNPQDDVVSGLLQRDLVLEDGARKLTDEEVFAYCRLVMHAGGGTTWRQLGITLLMLMLNEGYWEACLKNRDLVPAAVEESIRWLPNDPFMPRLVTKDVEVAGWRIPAGSRVDLCMGAANRDPARWENPDKYDIFRPFQYNLGTAMGPHQCLGYAVTRQEMIVAVNGLLDRFPNMRLDLDEPAPQFIGSTHQRGISALPVILR